MITKKRHMKQLQDNLQILNNIVSGADTEYPALRELFTTHSGANKGKPNALYNKLVCLHDYALHFEDDGEKRMEDAGRGWEWYASQNKLVEMYGSNKETWRKAINKLSLMGLVGIFNPRMTEDGEKYNTPGQQYSAERAKQGTAMAATKQALLDYGYSAEYVDGLTCRPCRWYRIHHYTGKLLMRAEALAPLVKAGAARDKDSMRDAVGAKMANAITDTAYDEHQLTNIRRKMLVIYLINHLVDDEYTIAERVINAAYLGEWGSYQRWEDTWKSYLPQLKKEFALKVGRPSKMEKEKWGLMDDRHIIRRE